MGGRDFMILKRARYALHRLINTKKGFTLVEVLVAFVLLTVFSTMVGGTLMAINSSNNTYADVGAGQSSSYSNAEGDLARTPATGSGTQKLVKTSGFNGFPTETECGEFESNGANGVVYDYFKPVVESTPVDVDEDVEEETE